MPISQVTLTFTAVVLYNFSPVVCIMRTPQNQLFSSDELSRKYVIHSRIAYDMFHAARELILCARINTPIHANEPEHNLLLHMTVAFVCVCVLLCLMELS